MDPKQLIKKLFEENYGVIWKDNIGSIGKYSFQLYMETQVYSDINIFLRLPKDKIIYVRMDINDNNLYVDRLETANIWKNFLLECFDTCNDEQKGKIMKNIIGGF